MAWQGEGGRGGKKIDHLDLLLPSSTNQNHRVSAAIRSSRSSPSIGNGSKGQTTKMRDGDGGSEDAYKVNSSVCDCALGVPARQHPPANFRESSTDNGLILSPPVLTRLSCYVPLHTMVRICHAI